MNVVISSGKLYGPKKVFLDYNYTIQGGNNDEVNVKSGAPVHDDMRAQFTQLIPHLAFICDYVPASEDLEKACEDYTELSSSSPLFEQLSAFRVTSVKYGTASDDPSIKIIGTKKLENGGTLNLVTPEILWSKEYAYLPYLQITAEKLSSEIIRYMDGKIAPDAQGKLWKDGEQDPDEEDNG